MPPIKSIKPKTRPLRAVGVTCGIGSMLVGARQAGFEVLGNIEWRRYYHYKDQEGRNTFTENFPGAVFPNSIDDLSENEVLMLSGADLVLGHPECGNFSQLGGVNKGKEEKLKDPCDIPLFVDLVARLRPRFFVMDDLPKSFGAFSMEEYFRRLPDYDLFPEWVSNWGYGNSQDHRNRMFMIGSLKSERWVFVPGESESGGKNLKDTIGDLLGKTGKGVPNHDPGDPEGLAQKNLSMRFIGDRPTWEEVGEFARTSWTPGESMTYYANDGTIKRKPGCKVEHWERTVSVQDGGSYKIHPVEFRPLTIRERARIQGFPDDFIFYGTKLKEGGRYNPDQNIVMAKQTGKAMPIQFCRYVAEQVSAHLRGIKVGASGVRTLKPNPFVDQAKKEYCSSVGYSDQEGACRACWMSRTCEIRVETYGIGGPVDLPAKGGRRVPLPVDTVTDKEESEPTLRLPSPTPPIPATDTEVVRFDDQGATPPILPLVDLAVGRTPLDYHCDCRFCSKVIGELIRKNGSYYSRLERWKYYDRSERGGKGHAAKTPLHLARWAVQRYSRRGDWILDPTAGAGTSLVEAIVQGRSGAGMELQFKEIISANVRKYAAPDRVGLLGFGDARNLTRFLSQARVPRPTLVINNPPYSGDEHQTTLNLTELDQRVGNWSTTFKYQKGLPNLAFLREGEEYWRTITSIYRAAVDYLLPGGHIVVGVKDMMRKKVPFMLHRFLAEVLDGFSDLDLVGTAFLKHYPSTLFLNTYEKMYGARPPLYQTILVFRKKGEKI